MGLVYCKWYLLLFVTLFEILVRNLHKKHLHSGNILKSGRALLKYKRIL